MLCIPPFTLPQPLVEFETVPILPNKEVPVFDKVPLDVKRTKFEVDAKLGDLVITGDDNNEKQATITICTSVFVTFAVCNDLENGAQRL